MVHGYASSGLHFYRIMKKLKDHFRTYYIDLIGMGASERTPFSENSTVDETEEYFTNFIEQWRLKMGLEEFFLAAHSFGGYVCGCYAEKYP